MNHLKIYEKFDKKRIQIEKFCNKYYIKNFKINNDLEIDVDGDVKLYGKDPHKELLGYWINVKWKYELPYKFGKTGYISDDKTGADEKETRFVHLLNDYHVIRNGDTIIQDRIEDVFYDAGIIKLPEFKFKNYKIV